MSPGFHLFLAAAALVPCLVSLILGVPQLSISPEKSLKHATTHTLRQGRFHALILSSLMSCIQLFVGVSLNGTIIKVIVRCHKGSLFPIMLILSSFLLICDKFDFTFPRNLRYVGWVSQDSSNGSINPSLSVFVFFQVSCAWSVVSPCRLIKSVRRQSWIWRWLIFQTMKVRSYERTLR